jgi:hypothetical protein
VPIDDAEAALNFIVHKGDEKDPGPDQSIVPADQATAWIVSGDPTVHRPVPRRSTSQCCTTTGPPATTGTPGRATSRTSGACTCGTARRAHAVARPLKPVRSDRFGVVFEVPAGGGATELKYILHKGDTKDLEQDQVLDLVGTGHEVWILAGQGGVPAPVERGGSGEPATCRPSRPTG